MSRWVGVKLFWRNSDPRRGAESPETTQRPAEDIPTPDVDQTLDPHVEAANAQLDRIEGRLAALRQRHVELATVDLRTAHADPQPSAASGGPKGSVHTLDLRAMLTLADDDGDVLAKPDGQR